MSEQHDKSDSADQPEKGLVLFRHQGETHRSTVYLAEYTLLIIVALLILLAIVLPARIWVVILSGVGMLVGLSFLWVYWLSRRVILSRKMLYAWVQVGDQMEEVFTLANFSSLPLLAAEITDHSNLPQYDASGVQAVDANQRRQWRQEGVSRRRGVYRLGPTSLRFGDPLGLFKAVSEYSSQRELLVYPPILHDEHVPDLSGGGEGRANSRQRSLIETAAIGGIRHYVPGDPIRRIHWPLSVRHQSFLVKEFDREMGGDTWLVLDSDQAVHSGSGEDSTLEDGVIWAATYAWHLIRAGRGVGLLAYGPHRILIPPGQGAEHFWNVMRALAPVEAQTSIPMGGLLQELKPFLARGHSLVAVTPSCQGDWPMELMQPGLRSASKQVVLLDTSAESSDPRSAVAGMSGLLTNLGIPVRVVNRRLIQTAQPAAPGVGSREYTITPWGGVAVRERTAEVDR